MFDSHAHYDDKQFDEDREQLLQYLFENGVSGFLNASSDIESSKTDKTAKPNSPPNPTLSKIRRVSFLRGKAYNNNSVIITKDKRITIIVSLFIRLAFPTAITGAPNSLISKDGYRIDNCST